LTCPANGAGAANADAVDDTFVASLAQAGIPQISPNLEISAGHAVCQNLDEGATPDQLLAAFVAKKVFATKQLWLVPIDGGTPTPLMPANDGQEGEILGDETAWQLPGGMFGVHGGNLELQATQSCGESLLSYDPVANTSTVLLGPPVNGGGVVDAMAYPGQQ